MDYYKYEGDYNILGRDLLSLLYLIMSMKVDPLFLFK